MMKKMVNGIEVICSKEEENALIAEWAANDIVKANNEYAEKRIAEYGDWRSQLDIMYHQGFDGWVAFIKAIKDKYPKPENAESNI